MGIAGRRRLRVQLPARDLGRPPRRRVRRGRHRQPQDQEVRERRDVPVGARWVRHEPGAVPQPALARRRARREDRRRRHAEPARRAALVERAAALGVRFRGQRERTVPLPT